MNRLQPIRLLPARERSASVLRTAILTKEVPEGTIIKLEEIASKLEVSHTPVREALQILAREGLIKLSPNKGAKILAITPQVIHEHYETRRVLECAAIATVCLNNADTTEIEMAFKQSEEALKAQAYSNYANFNQAFHMAIWSAANNTKMKAILSELSNGLSMGKNITEKQYAHISIKEHALILEAILTKDAALAEKRMSDHITRSMKDVLTRFD
ncbi:MAG: GntR family transcriptional regulator [Saezia sp.]